MDGRQFFDEKLLDEYDIEGMLKEFRSDMPTFNPYDEFERMRKSHPDYDSDDDNS